MTVRYDRCPEGEPVVLKKRLILILASVACAVVIFVSMISNFLEVDLSLIGDRLGPIVRAGFDFGDEFVDEEENLLIIQGDTLLASFDAATGAMERDTACGKILRLLRILIIPLYVLAAAIAVLSAINRSWSFRVSAVLSAMGLFIAVCGMLLVFPMAVAGRIPQAAIFMGLTSEKAEPVIREAVAGGLGTGWWIMTAGMGILLVLSILGILSEREAS